MNALLKCDGDSQCEADVQLLFLHSAEARPHPGPQLGGKAAQGGRGSVQGAGGEGEGAGGDREAHPDQDPV